MWEWGWRRGLPTPRSLAISTLSHDSSDGRSAAVRLCFHGSLSPLRCPSWRDAHTLHMWLFPKTSSASTKAVLGTSMRTACCFSSHSHSPSKIETPKTVGKLPKLPVRNTDVRDLERVELGCHYSVTSLQKGSGSTRDCYRAIMWPGNQHFRVGLILPWLTEGSSCILLTP